MTLYWASWYSGNYADEGCTAPPFEFWVTGQRDRPRYGLTEEQYKEARRIQDACDDEDQEEYWAFLDEHSRDDCTICALIEAENEAAVFDLVRQYFPDCQYRFCDESDGNLGDRFR